MFRLRQPTDELKAQCVKLPAHGAHAAPQHASHMTMASPADLGYQSRMNSAWIGGYLLTV
jgi:hypothetical protein